jgi:hypothetical protein
MFEIMFDEVIRPYNPHLQKIGVEMGCNYTAH